MSTTPTRKAKAELRPSLVKVSFDAADSPAAATPGATSSPEVILACTSGSSSRSFHIRLTTSEVTKIPMTQAGMVMARIWLSPRL